MAKNPFTYRGYYYDGDIGFYYLQSRYYDPAVGRFVNGDEVDYFIDISHTALIHNAFAYVLNDPNSNADFTGKSLTAILVGIAIGAIVGG